MSLFLSYSEAATAGSERVGGKAWNLARLAECLLPLFSDDQDKAIAEAKKHFDDDEWGVAYNGDKVRTQCHLHLHVGRFIPAAESSKFKLVRRIEDIPVPAEGGVLIHPVKGGYHVLTGEEIMETALVR